MWAQLWPFGDHDGVEMHDAQVPLREQAPNMLEKAKAVRIFPLRIGVRKMRANITETRGAQKCVTDGVCQRVSIAMAHRTFCVRHLARTENKLAACGTPVEGR